MNPYVRDRIQRKLDTLSDERLYQVLDYVEFLEAKYAERAASPVNMLRGIAETVEDTMRSGGIAVGTISETMGWFNKIGNALNGAAQSTMSVANGVVNAAKTAVDQVSAPAQPTGTQVIAPNSSAEKDKPVTTPTIPPEAAA
ncbi:MAG: DUF2281 domain-containing protein [Gemmatimonadaceae bacterium]